MIIRIVKMTFQPESVEAFLANFEKNKAAIRSFPGCNRLELLQEKGKGNVYFTYSWWEQETDLENYRQSELFRGVWQLTKTFFAAKPEAWSLENRVTL
ncbi:MAG TPA: antibiotic biosynthesis monooxygenase [Cryomorphaceae bacterium]|nr:antibiotic biosynthesis monooxygenase [Owenweeksia sp.]MBG00505.1 antibiotic biosynthesis monooxygenase [Owenweeksia sp.]HAD96922.1 antibiotic biosynthesis monooxygenase [Cryomorphaceae bacterium]HBF20614.1 antibiotic biosynthesis monooxygenase [Cryomorphaceae bacterium]HCQ17103.1 antibiotic biosynthesis monooxygenase [Cryomorphaceae bacterium]|tara:strand:- start:2125 stop:2418 length:294 start_codon:yes stop_codon:yes gene_type:complete